MLAACTSLGILRDLLNYNEDAGPIAAPALKYRRKNIVPEAACSTHSLLSRKLQPHTSHHYFHMFLISLIHVTCFMLVMCTATGLAAGH
jgi:hypothetical protein